MESPKKPQPKITTTVTSLTGSVVLSLKQACYLVVLEGHILIKQSVKSIDSIFSVFWGATINKTLTEYNDFYSLFINHENIFTVGAEVHCTEASVLPARIRVAIPFHFIGTEV